MAVKHNNSTRIGDGREGIFNGVTPGSLSSFPTASEGKMFWHSGEKAMYIYLGGAWKELT